MTVSILLRVVHKGRPQKYLFSDPLSAFVRIWLTPSSCERPHLALDTALWSPSVLAITLKMRCSLMGWYVA